jgi:hypothetical protein
MRTKTLLLAAAALAAGISYSEAQSNVYSQNIVGYVNVVLAGSGEYTLVATPLDNDGSNDMISLLSATLPVKSAVSIFNPATGAPVTATKGSAVTAFPDGLGFYWTTNFNIPPGTGFFVKTPNTSGPITNTFVGNVVNSGFGSGSTNTMALPNYTILAGSPLPVAGTLTDSGPNTLNLALPAKSTISTYNSATGQPTTATLGNTGWTTNLTLNVGQGFYITSKTATNWVQTLQ